MAGKKKTTQSRIIDEFCVKDARYAERKALKEHRDLDALMYKQIKDFCISEREKAKGRRVKK
ncbi:MAG: hypothetical protein ACREBU_13440 [Nitrososphaera sp.]